ncbi:MAG: DUF2442 domain-containing protein [Desulfobacteraceae bacterium]|nr:MAG: DUF2442 domain-containing protein [Desulfobacteraceae bacterium]
MNVLAKRREFIPLATMILFAEDDFTVALADGRQITIPYEWFPRLANATKIEREKFEFIGNGIGIHWPLIDEDISVEGLLR